MMASGTTLTASSFFILANSSTKIFEPDLAIVPKFWTISSFDIPEIFKKYLTQKYNFFSILNI